MANLLAKRDRFLIQLLWTVVVGGLCVALSLATTGCLDQLFGGGDDDPGVTPPVNDPVGEAPCAACFLPEQCGGSADLCLANFETHERFCGLDCRTASCPSGFRCATLGSSANGEIKQCLPDGDTCGLEPTPCDPACGAGLACENGQCYRDGDWLAERALCVDLVNAYRARLDLLPLLPDADLEDCAMEAAEMDALSGQAHSHFESTSGCYLVSEFELEIGGWSLEGYGSVDAIVDYGIGTLWSEGPGSMAYGVLAGALDSLGCGIHVTAAGAVWVTLELR